MTAISGFPPPDTEPPDTEPPDTEPVLWFGGPDSGAGTSAEDRRPALTKERVVAEALTLIAHDGVPGLTMRALAGRLGVVPGALYRHVPSTERLQDLVLDGVLAEIDTGTDTATPWPEQITTLAHRLRDVLTNHPGVAGLLTTRDPLGPHSLALAEAFLRPLHAAGFSPHHPGLAFFLILDYTLGFEVGNTHISVNHQRVHDPETRNRLHQFFRTLPSDRFPTLTALGEHVWLDNRDERFTTGLNTLITGLAQQAPP